MDHCRSARAFLHCSSTGVYEAPDGEPQRETDPLGDNHRVMMPTYSISKIAAEAVVRTTCRMLDVPTTIARLNVPYGDNGGWPAFHLELIMADQPVPVHPHQPSRFNPIHEDDIVAMIPALLGAATVPATIVNWGGDEETSIEEWSEYMADLVGHEARFDVTPNTIGGIPTDNTRRRRDRRTDDGGLEGRHAAHGGGHHSMTVPPARQYTPCSRSKKPSSTR